nr:hypothetical protein [Tanacetum cinerariifolium]
GAAIRSARNGPADACRGGWHRARSSTPDRTLRLRHGRPGSCTPTRAPGRKECGQNAPHPRSPECNAC